MSKNYRHISIFNLISKIHRDFKNTDINESDVIEWIGEALEFLKIPSLQEETVAFLEVENYQTELPSYLHQIIQIARNNNIKKTCINDVINTQEEQATENNPVLTNCKGEFITDYNVTYYRPFFDLQYEYLGWTNSNKYQEDFTPVRLSNHSFFNTLVCEQKNVYENTVDEYTISGDKLRFSFKSGQVAVAYLKQSIDLETGYPNIPDDISIQSAITYYVIWKIKERECWMNREGSCAQAQKANQSWLKYINQAKKKALMPSGVDDYQNLMEQSRYLIPRFNRYYGFFGNLNKKENRPFKDPERRNVSLNNKYYER